MYLKSLEIQGFKSFAEKIQLGFHAGMTAVVGPNGSGKSNIADAVRWVLGEQSAKSLRGGKMEDVIFAGTQHRKAVGFAQVSLTIDNTDGSLPVEYAEVTVTRRMYRSGESEYLMNKTQCRLKDIQELFMNTGVGKEGYSIIGQGRIDEILSNKSEDRRLIFEEAAGIMKYKVRKKEAERKLDSTAQNMLRINDIILELEAQIGPLMQQAETARKWLDYSSELKGIEVTLFLDTMDKIREKQTEVDQQLTDIRDQIHAENAKLDEIRDRNKQRTEGLEQKKALLENYRTQVHAMESEIEKSEGDIRIALERITSLTSANDSFGEDLEGMKTRLQTMDADMEKKQRRVAALERDAAHFTEELKDAEARLAAVMAKLDEGERQVEESKQAIMDKQDILSDVRVHINNLKNDMENCDLRKSRLTQEILAAGLEKDRENMQKEDLEIALRKVREQIALVSDTLTTLESTREGEKRKVDTLRQEREALLRELHGKESRLKVLKDLEESMEGYHHSVKAVLRQSQEVPAFGKGIHGALAQLVRVDETYETAVEICLGGALQNIVTDDEYTAKRAIEYLKQSHQGRATFLPVTAVKSRIFDESQFARIMAMDGFVAVASEKVTADKRFKPIIENLLGRTVIVANMDAGIRMARAFDYGFRIVTVEGELLNAGGSMTGGSQSSKSSSILGRQRHIVELEKEMKLIGRKAKELTERLATAEAAIAESDASLEITRKQLSELELVRLRDESHVARLVDNVRKLAAKQEMMRTEETEIKGVIQKLRSESAVEAEKLSKIEAEIASLKETVQTHQTRNKDEQKKRDDIHADINDYRVSVHSVQESRVAMLEQIAAMKEEREQMTGSIEKRATDRLKNEGRIISLHAEIEGIKVKIAHMGEEKTGREMKLAAQAEEVHMMEDEMSGLLEAVSGHNEAIFALQEEHGRLEARRVKMEAELENLQNRLWDEYGLTPVNAEPLKQEIQNIRTAQTRVNTLKSDIRELGPVNVAAIEDYAKTKERLTFMTVQRDDLVQAEEKLKRVIHDMMLIMKKQFLEQFELINRNFSQVFKELFEGGYAEVQLVDADNVLDSGIDIHVQPPGKKLVNMMLLSGGERAMVAIALLFAILRMRPAPFYLLDEIEASLDDANVFKFADYIKRFTANIQFIVITHRKGTMEASDTLYGVTMQEHGVSKVVSMRLDHPDIEQVG